MNNTTRQTIAAIIENAELTKQQAKAYFLVRYHGLSQAAKMLNLSENVVKTRYFAAVDKIAALGQPTSGRQRLSSRLPNMDGEY